MATILKRQDTDGGTRFQVKIRLRGFPPQSKTFRRKTDAERWASSTESAMRERRDLPNLVARKHTLAEVITYYLETVKHNPPKTLDTKRQQLAWWQEKIGPYTMDRITPGVLSQCRNALRDTPIRGGGVMSPASANRYLAALSRVLTVAVRELGYLDSNPMLKVEKCPEPRGRKRFLQNEEVRRLLEAAAQSNSKDLHCAVAVSLATGARKMEVLGLRWRDVDLNGQRITLKDTKNGETRSVPLKGYALGLMRERRAVRRLDTDLVFPGKTDRGGEARPIDLRTPFETALKRAAIADFRWHDLRHTAASYLAMNGASLPEIAEVLGHKTLSMVKRYAHLSEGHTSRVVESMNEKMFGGGNV